MSLSYLKMNNNKVKKSRDTSPPATPITIQVQVRAGCVQHVSRVSRGKVPGGGDPAVTNSHLLPQQDCPVFTGDCVMNGAFKKISNAV